MICIDEEEYKKLKDFYQNFSSSISELNKYKEFYDKYKDSIENKKMLNKKYYESGLKDEIVHCADCGVDCKRLCWSNHQKTKKHIKNAEIKNLKEKLAANSKEMFFMVKM